jgi:acyl-CoA synthetase (AMP-forming)/AMP-acid ligase II
VLFSEFLETCSNAFPNKEALACQGRGLTLGRIEAPANSLRSALTNDGLRPQDGVAVCLGNSVDSVVSAFGALKAFMVSQYIESCRYLPKTSTWENQRGRPSESEGGA